MIHVRPLFARPGSGEYSDAIVVWRVTPHTWRERPEERDGGMIHVMEVQRQYSFIIDLWLLSVSFAWLGDWHDDV